MDGLAGGISGFAWLTTLLWLTRALGLLIVGPPLLVLVTAGLIRRGVIQGEPLDDRQGEWDRTCYAAAANDSRSGDWIEIAGLATGASILCLTLGSLQGRRELLGWQLWGMQLLLIVWASVRQGLRGGTLVAAAAAALPLLVRQFGRPASFRDPLFLPLLQTHLLAQCAAGVLVAAAASWVRMRENGYRQIVSHIPVVIYSARLVHAGRTADPSAQPVGMNVAEITLVSAASSRLLDCPAEQLLGDYSRWLWQVHPDDREVLLAAIEQLTRQEQPVTCEYRLNPARNETQADPVVPSAVSPSAVRNAELRWLRDTLAPHRDADGRLLGWDGVVTDITEQRRLADDLRRTTSMFHALVANLPTGVFFVQGPHGQPILVNARARQLLGQREDAAAGLEHLSRVYRLYRPDGTLYPVEELPVDLALRQGRTTMRDDIVVHRPDGRRVPLVTWAAPVELGVRGGPARRRLGAGRPHRPAPGRGRPQGQRRPAPRRHRDHGRGPARPGRPRRDRQLQPGGVLPSSACPPSGCAISRCSIWTGSSSARTARRCRARTTPAQTALRTSHPVRNIVLGVCPSHLVIPDARRCADGEQRWDCAGCWSTPCPWDRAMEGKRPKEEGKKEADPTPVRSGPAGVVTTFSDISAYIHAREAIRASEERYRGLVESLPLMVVLADRDMRIDLRQPGHAGHHGLRPGRDRRPDGLGEPSSTARTCPTCTRLAARLWPARPIAASSAIAPRMAARRWLHAQPTALPGRRRGRHHDADAGRDARAQPGARAATRPAPGTDRPAVERRGPRFQQPARRRAEPDRSGAGHLPREHPAHADLRRITEAGEQAAGLAAQFLAFSKQKPAAARRVEINGVTRRTLELLQATLPANICIQASLAPGDTTVFADETQVQQVVMNLCLNARDAMPQGGALHVETCLEPASGEGGRAKVRLSVQDSGKGMSDDVRGRIFEPFFSTREGGTGLGLAVVQQIVESYGGTIEVNSRPGEGSRFDIRWPIA